MSIEIEPYRKGNSHPESTVSITRQDIAKYAGASGDYNLPHVDENFAKEAGYDSIIAMGMLTAGIAGSFINQWLGVEHVVSFDVRFEDIVYPGDELTYTAEITKDGDEELVVSFKTVNQDADVVLTGEVVSAIPE